MMLRHNGCDVEFGNELLVCGMPVCWSYTMSLSIENGQYTGTVHCSGSEEQAELHFIQLANVLAAHGIRLVFSYRNSIAEPNSYLSGGRWVADIVSDNKLCTVPLDVSHESIQTTRN